MGAPAATPALRCYTEHVTRPTDFALPDERGATYRLADRLREETVVVLFYRGDW